MCYADNLIYPVSWYVLFETLGRYYVNKIERKKTNKGFRVLGRSFSMIWQKVLLSNTYQSSFVLYIKFILSCVIIRYVRNFMKE